MKIDIGEMPEGYVALDHIVLTKVLNKEGEVRYLEHFPITMPTMEQYGMVVSVADSMRERIQRGATPL